MLDIWLKQYLVHETIKAYREKVGVQCKKCKVEDHYWLGSKEQNERKSCHFRMSLKSGTVMENSKLPYQNWFIAIHLLYSYKKKYLSSGDAASIGTPIL